MPASDTWFLRCSNILKLKEEVQSKMMIGDMSIEEGLAYYKIKASDLEIDKILNEIN